jgi:hypothetical protein
MDDVRQLFVLRRSSALEESRGAWEDKVMIEIVVVLQVLGISG